MNAVELRQKRAGLIHLAREVHEAAEGEGRALSAEEQAQFDRLMDEADELRVRFEREERMSALEDELRTSVEEPQTRRQDDEGGRETAASGDGAQTSAEFTSRGLQHLTSVDPAWAERAEWRGMTRTLAPEYVAGFERFLRGGVRELSQRDVRALQADSDEYGGYLTAPMQFVDRLLAAVDNAVILRQWATVFTVATAEALGVPSLENDPADADWTTELATGSEDSDMSFGTRALHPHALAKRIKISRKLLRMVPSGESLVRSRLAYKFGITEEKAFMTGSGAGQPLGVFTASADGISTDRDVSTDNTTSAVTFDGLIEAKYALKAAYWPRAKWLAHSDMFKQASKLKDGNGEYIWRESVRAGEPDMLLGLPTHHSEYAPNTFTSGLYVGILGDFSHYWIADALGMEVQRLEELYAETNQVGLIGRLACDGMPVLEEAFVRVKLG